MNSNIIKFLKDNYDYDVGTEIYDIIDVSKKWWKGYYKPFHQYKFDNGETISTREMYILKMGKKIAEDMASLTLNEETELSLQSPKENKILQDYFEKNKIWTALNQLWEKVQYSGLGAVVNKFDGEKVYSDFISGENIIPLTWDNSSITEAAFTSVLNIKGKEYLYLEIHLKNESGNYEIHNYMFIEDDGKIKKSPLPEGVAEVFNTASDVPMFTFLKRNVVNSIVEDTAYSEPLIYSVIPQLQACDIAYNNFVNDIKDGQKMIFYNRSMLSEEGRKPSDTNQRHFVLFGTSEVNGELIHEHNPDLRVDANSKAIQEALDILSFKAGFGTKHYQFNSGTITTATQYVGDKQDLKQNVGKMEILLRDSLIQYAKSVLNAFTVFNSENLSVSDEVLINFSDNIQEDDSSDKARDMQLITMGIMQAWEYRVKWMGEDEEKAKSMVMGVVNNMFEEEIQEDEISIKSEEGSVKSLNGAQTQSLIAIMGQFSSGAISEGQAVNLISTAIGITKDDAKKILNGEV